MKHSYAFFQYAVPVTLHHLRDEWRRRFTLKGFYHQ